MGYQLVYGIYHLQYFFATVLITVYLMLHEYNLYITFTISIKTI